MNIQIKQKGFTLIEILIATAIFATVMIIVVATFSWAAGYNNRLKETRRVGQEVRGAMDEISKNIRLANGSAQLIDEDHPLGVNIGEITFLYCENFFCTPTDSSSPFRYKSDLTSADPSEEDAVSNGILILQKDSNKVIVYMQSVVFDMFSIQKIEREVNNWDSSIDFGNYWFGTPLNPEDDMALRVWFGGYGPIKDSRNQQPYAEIYLIAETRDYDSKQPSMRSRFHLRTMVESRDYNP